MLAMAGMGVAAASAYYLANRPIPTLPPFDLEHQTIVEVQYLCNNLLSTLQCIPLRFLATLSLYWGIATIPNSTLNACQNNPHSTISVSKCSKSTRSEKPKATGTSSVFVFVSFMLNPSHRSFYIQSVYLTLIPFNSKGKHFIFAVSHLY